MKSLISYYYLFEFINQLILDFNDQMLLILIQSPSTPLHHS